MNNSLPRSNGSRHESFARIVKRNELTQKAIAKECAEWVRRKVKFRSNITNENMGGFINVENGED